MHNVCYMLHTIFFIRIVYTLSLAVACFDLRNKIM